MVFNGAVCSRAATVKCCRACHVAWRCGGIRMCMHNCQDSSDPDRTRRAQSSPLKKRVECRYGTTTQRALTDDSTDLHLSVLIRNSYMDPIGSCKTWTHAPSPDWTCQVSIHNQVTMCNMGTLESNKLISGSCSQGWNNCVRVKVSPLPRNLAGLKQSSRSQICKLIVQTISPVL